MNKRNLLFMKIKMFITSYCPLYIILLALQIKEYPVTFNSENILVSATAFAIILWILIAISALCTIDLVVTKGNEPYKYDSIDRTGDAVISYMMTYLVPLLSGNFLSYNGFVVNVTLFVLIAIMYIRLDLVYFNPTWLLLGYSVYTTGKGDLIISNIPYGTLKQYKNISLQTSYLVKGIYLIQKKDNK